MPSAVKLQIVNLRHCNGYLDIIVVDDSSPTSKEVRKVCDDMGVPYYPIPIRQGHYMGAKQSYIMGLTIARSLWPIGTPNICCISQRFIVTKSKWIEEGEKLMGDKMVLYGSDYYPNQEIVARTECILFNTNKWIDSNLYKQFFDPRNAAATVELFLGRMISKIPDKIEWPMLGKNRTDPSEEWFSHHKVAKDKYEELAAKLGIKLKHDFHCDSFFQMEKQNYRG